MDPNFIISPVVGAAIGGFANWLAIQMLFYPLVEKRIFGIRIPFTPGLIPKERKRIAQSVASTVANYFLSEDVIVNAVVSPRAEEQFKQYIRELINKQRESKETLKIFFENISGKSVEKFYEENEEKLISFIEEQVKSSDFAENIAVVIENELDKLLDKNILQLSQQDENTIIEKIQPQITKLLNSEFLNNSLGNITAFELNTLIKSKKKLGEVLPGGVIDFIKAKSVANSDKVAEMIIEFIASSSVQFKMRKFFNNSIEGSFKLRMLSKVVDTEKIFESVFDELISFLEQAESRREIASFLLKTIDTAENRKVKDVSEEYGIEIESEKVKQLLNTITSAISIKENIPKLIAVSDMLSLNVKELIDAFDVTLVENKGELIRKILYFVQNSISIKDIIKPILKNKVQELSEVEVGKVIGYIKDNEISMIENIIVGNFKRLISGESDRILKVIDISKIVEDKINAFDIGEMEEIMLGVIRKDIVVMRVFEAGIGFLIGFLIPLYPYILRLFK